MRNYLLVCNNIFERGLLSSDKITAGDQSILEHIDKGYKYFEDWWDSLNAEGDFRPKSTEEKRFISWQTWDLLRVTVFDFRGFVNQFLTQNSDYYVHPLKINGSAAETLFSQFRFETNCKLTSINYASARSRILMKKGIHDMEVLKQPVVTEIPHFI